VIQHSPTSCAQFDPKRVSAYNRPRSISVFQVRPLVGLNTHCATCSPACVILCRVAGSCRGPIESRHQTQSCHSGQSQGTRTIQWTNQDSKWFHAADAKRGNMCANESRLILVLLLIKWKSGASFLSQSCSVVMRKPTTFRHSNEIRSIALIDCLKKNSQRFMIQSKPMVTSPHSFICAFR